MPPSASSSGGSWFRMALSVWPAEGPWGRGGAMERAPADHHLIQNRAECEQVRAMVDRLGPDLFRRHITHRPHDASRVAWERHPPRFGLAQRFIDFGQTKIQNLNAPLGSNPKIFGL